LEALVQLGVLGHFAVLILDTAGAFLVVVSENTVVAKVRAFHLVLLNGGLGLCQVGLLRVEVRILVGELSLQTLNLLVSGGLLTVCLDLLIKLSK
jgi:hypothetical protein